MRTTAYVRRTKTLLEDSFSAGTLTDPEGEEKHL
jgi:hypothetical protein